MNSRPQSVAAAALLAGLSWAFQGQTPPSVEPPVPDGPALLTEVQKNQKAIDALVEQYACRKEVEELEPAKDGPFRTKSVKQYEVFYLGRREVDRLVAKGGLALPPEEQEAENRRVERKVKALLRKLEEQREREGRGEKKEEEAGISVFLRVERFENPRRVEFRGRNVVAFDFEQNPDYRAKTRLESLIQKLVGTLWVDDQAKEIVKLEAHLGDSMKIGGGLLASIHKGSAFVFEQALVNEEVWLPSYVEAHLEGRFLLKGVRQDVRVRYSDYKKFRVESVTRSVKKPS